MSSEEFEYLLNEIGPKVGKRDTNMRKAIPVKERLAVTLGLLATGNSFASLGYLFKISHQSISSALPDVYQALIEIQQNETISDASLATGMILKLSFPREELVSLGEGIELEVED
ncbi:hypothetical protein J437_LFUL012330 [Ladona fulva]|uniref:Transposase Helix-turn-helix domain-containing protein n=1 Tax=Ladona fulva TaxID=123851 RepID=A0A8K0KH49_LADFU|nr:hypothetical protein J437_LFUL012330 [Ladona fulva]